MHQPIFVLFFFNFESSDVTVARHLLSFAKYIARLLIYLSQKIECNGLALSGAMCWVPDKLIENMTLFCNASYARRVFEMTMSKYKTLKILAGMWHQLVGEKEGVKLAFEMIFDWILDLTR